MAEEKNSEINDSKDKLEKDIERYLIAFSGGGAKGLVHVGAFHHLHDTKKKIASVAGTSAGAMIAALISAGYKPDDIIKKDGTSPLWEEIQKNFDSPSFLSDILGASQFNHLNRVYSMFREGRWLSLAVNLFGRHKTLNFLIAAIFSYFIFYILILALFYYEVFTLNTTAFFCMAGGAIMAILSIVVYAYKLAVKVNKKVELGICNLEYVEKIIEFCLAKKIGLNKDGDTVKFKDLTEIPLKIVATNITNSEVAMFSTDATPDESVSKAVAASICLPYIFSAKEIKNSLHYDGGIVSNLPAWVFEEERLVAPTLRAIAFRVEETENPDDKALKSTIIKRLMSSLLSAHQSIGLRSLVDLKEVVLETDFNLLTFRFTQEDAARIVMQGEKSAALVDDLYTSIPDMYCDLADKIRKEIASNITETLKFYEAPKSWQSARSFRVAFAVQEPNRPGLMWVKFSSGFRNSKDKGIMIPIRTSTAGIAFTTETTVLTIMGKSTNGVLNGPTDGYVRSIVNPRIKWIMGVPLELNELVDVNVGQQEFKMKIVLTVDGFDDIFSDVPSKFSISRKESWNDVIQDDVWKAIESVLEAHVKKRLRNIDDKEVIQLFPRLEDAASKHI